MSSKPAIFLAFANEKADPSTKLRLLSKERQSIEKNLDREKYDVIIVESTSPDDIFTKFNDPYYADRISVFHYAGHANSFGILLEDHQKATGNTHFKADGLVDFLASQKSLRLVFLNACSTKAQAETLKDKGIPNVIATSRSINDEVAANLAEMFYQALAVNKSIERALTEAGSMIKGGTHNENLRDLSWEGMEEEEETSTGMPWDLYGIGDWHLGADLGRNLQKQLRKGSEKCYQEQRKLFDRQTFVSNEVNQWLKRRVILDGSSMRLSKLLPTLWSSEGQLWHSMLMGNPGAGKTSSLLHLWKKQLEHSERPTPIYIPLFEYNRANSKDKEAFVRNYILAEYFGKPYGDEELEQGLHKWLDEPLESEQPKVILLLDGLNEVTVNSLQLQEELKKWSQYASVQLILASRRSGNYAWANAFHQADLEGISSQDVVSFLKDNQVKIPSNPKLLEQFQNPLMLSMYARTSHLPEGSGFIHNPSTQGELLNNFFSANLGNSLEKARNNPIQQHLYRWVFRHLLPRVAFEMERYYSGSPEAYTLSRLDFKDTIREVAKELQDDQHLEDCLYAFPETEGFWDALLDEELPKPDFAQLRKILEDDLQLINKRNGKYQFSQSIFRDFLSAIHLINQAQWGVYMQEVPESWNSRILPPSICSMIGEITGDYRNKPIFQSGEWQQEINNNVLHGLLDTCRGIFPTWVTETEEEDPYSYGDDSHGLAPGQEKEEPILVHKAIWNIINIWKTSRDHHLVGENLSDLDFNFIPLGGNIYSLPGLSPTNFGWSVMREENWITQGHILNINALCYSKYGQFALSASEDGSIREWDLSSGECYNVLQGHDGGVFNAYYAHDDKLVVSSSEDGTVKVWSLETQACLYTEKAKGLAIDRGVAVNPVKCMAIINRGDGVWELNLNNGELTETPYDANFTPCQFDQSYGSWLLGLGDRSEIIVYDAINQTEYLRFRTPPIGGSIKTKFSPDAYRLIVYGQALPIYEYNADTGELIAEHADKVCIGESPILDRIQSVQYHGDGERLAIAFENQKSSTVFHMREEKAQQVGGFDLGTTAIAFHPEGHRLLTASSMGQISEWDLKPVQEEIQINKGSSIRMLETIVQGSAIDESNLEEDIYGLSFQFINGIDYSPNATKGIWGSEEGIIQEWDLEGRRCLRVIQAHSNIVTHCLYADEEYAVSSSTDGTAKLWYLPNQQLIETFEHGAIITAMAIDRIGGLLITGGEEGYLKFWNWKTGECEYSLQIHQGGVQDLYMHPTERRVLSGGADATIREWNLETMECQHEWQSDEPLGIPAVCYEHTGNAAIFSSNQSDLAMWDFETNEVHSIKVQDFAGEANVSILDISYNPVGHKICCVLDDGSLREFDLHSETVEPILSLNAHLALAMAVRYSPDGKRALTSGLDGAVREWDLEQGRCLRSFPCLNWSVNGCDFQNMRSLFHVESNHHETLKTALQMYGANFGE